MFTLLLILLLLIALFTIWAPLVGARFLLTDTFVSTVDSLVVTSFLAIGAGMLMVSGNIDLSTSAIGAFGGVLCAVALRYWALPWPIAIIIGIGGSAIFGFANAILVNEFKFQPFIATLAMASVVKAVMMFVSTDSKTGAANNVSFSDPAMKFIGTYKLFGKVPFTIVIMLAAFIFYGLMLSKTKFGMNIYLVGGNPLAAKLAGINPKKVFYILFTNSAVLGGVSGIIMASRTNQGNLSALGSNQFTGLTAAILGGISFGGGTGGLGGAFVGLLILNVFTKGTAIVKFDTYWTAVMSGALLLVALTLDYFSQRRIKRKVRG